MATPIRSAKARIASGPVAPPAHPGDRRHAGIVPAGDVAVLDQAEQLALAQHRVVEVEAGELDLLGPAEPVALGHAGVLDHPVVQLPVVLELEGAEGVGDALDGVGDRVGVVVHRVDGPGVAGAVVGGVADPVEQRVAHLHVGGGQVDPGPQHAGAVGQVAGPHLAEEGEVLVDAAVPVGRRPPGLAEAAPVLLDLVVAQVVDVGLARPGSGPRPARTSRRSSRRRRGPGRRTRSRASATSRSIDSTYSTSSLTGLVSSKRRLQCDPYSSAIPKLRQIDLAWPMWR